MGEIQIYSRQIYVGLLIPLSMLLTDNILLNIFRPGRRCIYLQSYLFITYTEMIFELQRILCFELIAKANSNWFVFQRSVLLIKPSIILSLGFSNTSRVLLVKPMFLTHYPNSSPSAGDGSMVPFSPLLMQ